MLETPSTQATALAEFRLGIHPDRSQVVVAPSGELDLATADHVDREIDDLRRVGFHDIVVDLRAVTSLDSSGLRMLLAQARRARAVEHRFVLVSGPQSVHRTMEITGTLTAFTFVDRPSS